MFLEIKNKIENELQKLFSKEKEPRSLYNISPLLFTSIKDFVLREGKRIRPALFVLGYLGFSKNNPKGLYKAAASLELLHDFMLIHDDIIDKSQIRRNKPSMHAMLNKYLSSYKNKKFSGEDLSIVIGDVIYAISLKLFISVEEDLKRKEDAFKILINAAMYTGSGEFVELLAGLKNIEKIPKEEIYKIYELKTAYYTFSAPLMMGAILAGADSMQVKKLSEYGSCIGRAFQIKDDILDMFGDEKKIGKSTLTDLKESKKTLLVWYAYQKSGRKEKDFIKKIMSKEEATKKDLENMRNIIIKSGAYELNKAEISNDVKKAEKIMASSKMNQKQKTILKDYFTKILSLE